MAPASGEEGEEKLRAELFLCGDVMTGRGIDQVLPHPSGPELHEPYVGSALDYVELAERVNGPVPTPVDFAYVWGDALAELQRVAPDARIINLETAVTTSDAWQPKGINYRMNPRNVECLTAASVDCCVLANNHVLDWGPAGLAETLATLRSAGLRTTGAGRDREDAGRPATIETATGGRVLVFACASEDSGVPRSWAATDLQPGVSFLHDFSGAEAELMIDHVAGHREHGDIVVVSIHWGSNWGYQVPSAHRRFAHRLVDSGVIDVVHGHSSHHARGLEVYRGRPIFYGCGDFLTDYEGISGYEEYRGDLALMYFVALEDGAVVRLRLVPMQMKRFRLCQPSEADRAWIRATLDRESAPFGARVEPSEAGAFEVRWS